LSFKIFPILKLRARAYQDLNEDLRKSLQMLILQYGGIIISFILLWLLVGALITGPKTRKEERLHREKVENALAYIQDQLSDLKKNQD
jgi:hypothetical protein